MLSFEAWPFQEKELRFSVKISRALPCAPNPVQSVPQDAGSLLEQGQKTTEHVAKQRVQTRELRTGDESSSFRPETAALHPMGAPACTEEQRVSAPHRPTKVQTGSSSEIQGLEILETSVCYSDNQCHQELFF